LFWTKKRHLFFFLLFSYLLPGLWCYRNDRLTGHWMLTVQSGHDLLYYAAAGAESLRTGQPFQPDEMFRDVDSRLPPMASEADRNEAYLKKATRVFKEHPLALTEFCLIGCVKTLGTGGLEMIVDLLGKS